MISVQARVLNRYTFVQDDNNGDDPYYDESLVKDQTASLGAGNLSDVVMGAKDFMSLLTESELTGDNLIAEPKKVH